MGRKQKPYQTSWKEVIPGLCRDTNGRWRIASTGHRFTEANERRAVEKFYSLSGQSRYPELLEMKAPVTAISPVVFSTEIASTSEEVVSNAIAVVRATRSFNGTINMNLETPPAEWQASVFAPGSVVWHWLGEMLDNDPDYVAQMTGRPALAHFRQFPTPPKPVKISDVIAAYKQHSPATEKSKTEALTPFNLLVNFCDAKTLADFSEEKLAKFREHVCNGMGLTSSGTIIAYFSRCRSVLKLALRGQLDSAQLTACFERMKAKLYSPENNVEDDPHPISREDFHTLLNDVGKNRCPCNVAGNVVARIECRLVHGRFM
jgi:hypothetical protein